MSQNKEYRFTSGALGYSIHQCNGQNCQYDNRPKINLIKASRSVLKEICLDVLLITSPLILYDIVDKITGGK